MKSGRNVFSNKAWCIQGAKQKQRILLLSVFQNERRVITFIFVQKEIKFILGNM